LIPLNFSPVTEIGKNERPLTIAQPCNCKELNERNTQEAIFYKRLIAILLSNLAMQASYYILYN